MSKKYSKPIEEHKKKIDVKVRLSEVSICSDLVVMVRQIQEIMAHRKELFPDELPKKSESFIGVPFSHINSARPESLLPPPPSPRSGF